MINLDVSYRSIKECIEEHSLNLPEKVALIEPEGYSINYYDLNRQISSAHLFFGNEGWRKYHRIGVILPDSMMAAIAFLTISTSAIYVPLNPAFSDEQFKYYFDLLDIDAVVVTVGISQSLMEYVHEKGQPAYQLSLKKNNLLSEFVFSRINRNTFEEKDRMHTYENTTMICCTSGTTAIPKTVFLSHQNLLFSAKNRIMHFELSLEDRCLLITPMFRSSTLNALFAMLMVGGSVVCGGAFSPKKTFHLIREEQPTWLSASPTVWNTIVKHASNYQIVNMDNSLRFVRSGGGSLSEDLFEQLGRLFNVPVVITYGMTETRTIATNYSVPMGHRKNSVGVPAGCEVIIRNEMGTPVTCGNIGEITIASPAVMQGYAESEHNDKAFVDNYFRTGDIGYLDTDGYLYIVGRIKELINRGGEKISPFEIEASIMKISSVEDAAVFGIPSEDGIEEVGAAVVLEPGMIPDSNHLRTCLLELVIPYKIPTVWYHLNEIPRNAAGKIDRKKLKKVIESHMPLSRKSGVDELTPIPSDSIEAELLELWKRILKTDVGMEDDYFSMGGDSLKVAELHSGIEELYGKKIPLNTLFKVKTIAEQAILIRNQKVDKLKLCYAVPIRPSGDKVPIFLIHGGNGDVARFHNFVDHFDEGYPVYGLMFTFKGEPWRYPTEISEIAERYIADMIQIQPVGPYHFAGACLGSIVAYEMARQMSARGMSVGFVGMFDGIIKSRLKILSKLRDNFWEVYGLDKRDILSWFTGKVGRRLFYYRSVFTRLLYRNKRMDLAEKLPDKIKRIGVLKNAKTRYSLAPYNGDIVFYKPVEYSWSTLDAIKKWSSLVPNVIQVEVPGNHNTIYQYPGVEVIAKDLEARVKKSMRDNSYMEEK